jgi:hypothetical protein
VAWAAWTIKPVLNRNDEGPGFIPGLFSCPTVRMASATEPPRTRLTRATLLRPQHDATEPGYFGGRPKWWTKAQREIDPNAILHLSVYERFAAEKVQHVYAMQPHRPENLSKHEKLK